ncbi:hypothetical protein JCM17478_33230 [Thermopirellula anaerolimosa]
MVVEVQEFAPDTVMRLRRALAESPVYELRDVTASIEDGKVVLCGTVSSFYHKQLAQEAVRAIAGPGAYDIDNRITVRSLEATAAVSAD